MIGGDWKGEKKHPKKMDKGNQSLLLNHGKSNSTFLSVCF
jgi:hypothetical protein